MRMAPPGRGSNSQTGLVNRCGPHHCATIFGSVQALNTSSRGASKTRVTTNSCSSFGAKFPVAMLFLLFLHVLQIFVETVETLGPEPPIAPHPIGDILERRGGNTAWPPLSFAPACYQAGVFQHLEVPGNLGGILLRAYLKQELFSPKRVTATVKHTEKALALAKELGVSVTTENRKAVKDADIVLLGVKPQVVSEVLKEIAPEMNEKTLVISVAASVPTSYIEQRLAGKVPVVRAMPNTP